MAMLEQQPHHVRRKIAFIVTMIVAVILLFILIMKATSSKTKKGEPAGSLLKAFYNSLTEGNQSTSEQK